MSIKGRIVWDINNPSKFMSKLLKLVKGHVKDNVRPAIDKNLTGDVLFERSGRLRKSITSKSWKNRNTVFTEMGINKKWDFYYIHEKETPTVIEADDRLVFPFYKRGGGFMKWISTDRVTIPSRPFIKPAMKDTEGKLISLLEDLRLEA